MNSELGQWQLPLADGEMLRQGAWAWLCEALSVYTGLISGDTVTEGHIGKFL